MLEEDLDEVLLIEVIVVLNWCQNIWDRTKLFFSTLLKSSDMSHDLYRLPQFLVLAHTSKILKKSLIDDTWRTCDLSFHFLRKSMTVQMFSCLDCVSPSFWPSFFVSQPPSFCNSIVDFDFDSLTRHFVLNPVKYPSLSAKLEVFPQLHLWDSLKAKT